MDGDWTMVVTVAAGLSLIGAIALTALTGLRFQRESQQLPVLRACETEINAAEKRLELLHQELDQLERTQREATHRRQLREEAESAASDEAAEARRQEIQSLEAQRQGLTDEVARVREAVQRERQILAQINLEQRAADQRRKEILVSIQELGQHREALSEDVAVASGDLKALRSDMATLQRELEAGHAQLSTMKQLTEDQAGLAEAVASAESRRNMIAAAARELEQRREALAEEVVDTNRAVKTAKAELLHLQEECEAVVTDLNLRRDEYAASFSETQQRHSALLKEVGALDRERLVLEERVATLRKTIPQPASDEAKALPKTPALEATPAPAKPIKAPKAPKDRSSPFKSPLAFLDTLISSKPTQAKPAPFSQAKRPAALPAAKPAARPTPKPKKPVARTTPPSPTKAEQTVAEVFRTTLGAIDRTISKALFGAKLASKSPRPPRRNPS